MSYYVVFNIDLSLISIVTSYTWVTYNTISVTTYHHGTINVKISAPSLQEVMPNPGKWHLVHFKHFKHNINFAHTKWLLQFLFLLNALMPYVYLPFSNRDQHKTITNAQHILITWWHWFVRQLVLLIIMSGLAIHLGWGNFSVWNEFDTINHEKHLEVFAY